MSNSFHLQPDACRRARLARDSRFDGLFFIAVKTTGIYCRPVCPASPPKEANVDYFPSALAASQQGYRPCLRCRPESAPGSPAWQGTHTTLTRAIKLIDAGHWQQQSLAQFCQRLGVGERHLRQLFRDELGMSPQAYRNFRRLMLAKQLLHQTRLPIADIAASVGFGSVRRFNAAFKELITLAPGQVRRTGKSVGETTEKTQLFLSYRPPYNWPWLQRFLSQRAIEGLEEVSPDSYQRTLHLPNASGLFVARHNAEKNGFDVTLWLQDETDLPAAVATIRRLLDLDADRAAIDRHLCRCAAMSKGYLPGIPLPGMATAFEAGVRAILGQQVSVAAARKLVAALVNNLGGTLPGGERMFPLPQAVADSILDFLAMPGSRRDTLKRFASALAQNPEMSPQEWLAIKGIGPWTVDYATMRLGDPDIWLGSDLGVRKGLAMLEGEPNPESWAPWRSYASLQMWQRLALPNQED
ncbi:AlkA N-terminal domain-containing protein [Porticoccus sp. W117]|uniref:DNA-3-methyladenine glycosylase 2 family protein n=1 Tax=Porticoccus sp. W117 TaxID=3054777 RepID=UPI002599815F|nr:AlkA N-terminal domain-containing protein [Porticoccus sp. W117]MDM3870903.1 AlkA N-terminal domain-containing protein [Porticoccus sp. W117]